MNAITLVGCVMLNQNNYYTYFLTIFQKSGLKCSVSVLIIKEKYMY